MQETLVWSGIGEFPWRRAWEPTSVFLGFPGGSDSKESACEESACNVPALGLERSPRGRHGNPFQYSCLENPHGQRSPAGYSPWGRKELDTTERLNTAHTLENLSYNTHWNVWPRNHWSRFNWKQSFKAFDGIGWTRKKRGQRRGERVHSGPRRLGLHFLKGKLLYNLHYFLVPSPCSVKWKQGCILVFTQIFEL